MNLLPAACLTAAYAWGTYHRNSPLFGGVIGRLPSPRDGRIALTFDDGPNPDATPRVLDVLRSYGVPATFFQLGRHVDAWPECAAAVGADGHDIGNHGWAHQKLTWAGPRRAARDVLDGTQSLERAHGRGRCGFGHRTAFEPFVDDAVHRVGQRLVGWSLGVFDSARPGAREIARRVIAGARPGRHHPAPRRRRVRSRRRPASNGRIAARDHRDAAGARLALHDAHGCVEHSRTVASLLFRTAASFGTLRVFARPR
ncbi:MAG: polysaccharide deacetylase family protein [Gemmatimonadaceae bacterium]